MSATAKQRMTLNNLSEPQQIRELNRQLEWVWNQLLGGLTSKALSTDFRSDIERRAAEVDRLSGWARANAAEKYAGGAQVAVGAGGDYATLGAFAAMVNNRTLRTDVEVLIVSDLSGDAELGGMGGAGRLMIDGGGHNFTGRFTLRGAGVPVTVRDLAVTGQTTVAGGHATFDGVTFDGCAGGSALRLTEGASCFLEDCTLNNADCLIDAGPGTRLGAKDIRGGDCDYFLAGEHMTACMSGTRPDGGLQTTACLCEPADILALGIDTGVPAAEE